MKNIKKIVKNIVNEVLNKTENNNQFDSKLKCIQSILKKEEKINRELNYEDNLWIEIRSELREIDFYFEHGYFSQNRNDYDEQMSKFLKGLDYSEGYPYVMGKEMGHLSYNGKKGNTVYRAIGNKILFRGVSLKDWERIKKQGFIDSDMRKSIYNTEGINLGQNPSTAEYYLPPNDSGIILAVSPKNLDLYMLNDEYVRVFYPIPIKNVIKVSDIFIKNSLGTTMTTNTDKKIKEIIDRVEKLGIGINC
jgi:hypothetical protein